MIYPIILYGNNVLRKKADEIKRDESPDYVSKALKYGLFSFLNKNNLLDKGIVSARFSLDSNKPFYNHGIDKFGSYTNFNLQ